MKILLSVDGSGVHAIMGAQFLKNLELELKKNNSSIYEKFDFYAGTSSGALLVGALVYGEKNGCQLVDELLTYDNIKKTFKKSWIDKISNTDKNCLITGYNIDQHEIRFFKSYYHKLIDKKTGKNFPKEIVSTVDAIDVSSAAPGIFPQVKYIDKNPEKDTDKKTKYGLDGAFFATNPTDCAYADMLKFNNDDNDIRILSLGLGKSDIDWKIGSKTSKFGIIQWASFGNLIERMNYLKVPIVNYRMDSFTNVLGHQYLRIGDISVKSIPLDSSKESDYYKLIELGNELWKENKEKVLKLLFN